MQVNLRQLVWSSIPGLGLALAPLSVKSACFSFQIFQLPLTVQRCEYYANWFF